MHNYRKIFLVFLLLFFLALLLSPFISLILPDKLTNHTYYRMAYQVIADKETVGCKTDECKAKKLFHYVIDHEFMQGEPYKCKPFESLIYGQAFCDFQARTLNALLGVCGIKSRYAMLFNDQGISRHTLNEVFLSNKWVVYDPALRNIFKDNAGNQFSLYDAVSCPNLVTGVYLTLLPLRRQPIRSVPTIYQVHLLDRIADAYMGLFKYRFFCFYQDLYLKIKIRDSQPEDLKLFLKARNYHLAYRFNLARKNYNSLLEKYPQGAYSKEAVFFLGMLYYDLKDFAQSEKFFKMIKEKNITKWKNAADYYLSLKLKKGV